MLELIWLCLILSICSAFDVCTRRIPNGVVLVGFIGLLILQFKTQNWQPLSFLIGLTVGLILWQLKMIGGGDSKLLALVSAAYTPAALPLLYLCISLAGAVQALYFLRFKKGKNLPYAFAILIGTAIFVMFKFLML